jgi:hypothetical protein
MSCDSEARASERSISLTPFPDQDGLTRPFRKTTKIRFIPLWKWYPAVNSRGGLPHVSKFATSIC